MFWNKNCYRIINKVFAGGADGGDGGGAGDGGWADPDPSDFTGPMDAPDDTPGQQSSRDEGTHGAPGFTVGHSQTPDPGTQTSRDVGTHGNLSGNFGFSPEMGMGDPDFNIFRNVPQNPMREEIGPQTLEQAYAAAITSLNDDEANELAAMMSRTELAEANKNIVEAQYEALPGLAKGFFGLTSKLTGMPSVNNISKAIAAAQGLAGQSIGLPGPGHMDAMEAQNAAEAAGPGNSPGGDMPAEGYNSTRDPEKTNIGNLLQDYLDSLGNGSGVTMPQVSDYFGQSSGFSGGALVPQLILRGQALGNIYGGQ